MITMIDTTTNPINTKKECLMANGKSRGEMMIAMAVAVGTGMIVIRQIL